MFVTECHKLPEERQRDYLSIDTSPRDIWLFGAMTIVSLCLKCCWVF